MGVKIGKKNLILGAMPITPSTYNRSTLGTVS